MKFTRLLAPMLTVICLAVLSACDNSHSFKLSGTITGAPDSLLLLERPGFNGRWLAVDSIRTNNDGEFSLKYEAPEHPEIFRLSLGDRFIYFPIDSTENLTLSTTQKEYGENYKLTGSANAKKLCRFDAESRHAWHSGADAVKAFKRKVVSEIILSGKGDIVSYYVITKVIDGKPLFSMEDPDDAGIFGAVANMYAQYRPQDPRTKMLEKMAVQARKNRDRSKGRSTVMTAEQTAIIDFTLPDKDNRQVTLSGIVRNGKPTLLFFSPLTEEESASVNREVASLFARYGSGMNFVQVCPDVDRIAWREAALGLPWTALVDSRGASSPLLASYNVSALPSFYIYDTKGELVKSAKSFAELSRILANI